MSIASVEQAVAERDRVKQAADRELYRECARAVEAGVPIVKVARAAGVTRPTIYAWIAELEDAEVVTGAEDDLR